jgi:8-oxo-dGTP pyrophosphatase MutT (NUDIX family)
MSAAPGADAPPVTPRPSATVALVRPAAGGFEVLLLKRAARGDQFSGAWVYPGGLLDPGDAQCHRHCTGLDDAAASAQLSLPTGGLNYHVAAIRECFEECGVLLGHGDPGALPGPATSGQPWLGWRSAVHRGERAFADLCSEQGWRLAADRLCYIAHRVTPPQLPKRFDTRFFLAVLPEGQQAMHDGTETVDHAWVTPAEAVADGAQRHLMGVTRAVAQMLLPFENLDALLAWARSPRVVERVMRATPSAPWPPQAAAR